MTMTRAFTGDRSLLRRLSILIFAAACMAGALTVSSPVFAQTAPPAAAVTILKVDALKDQGIVSVEQAIGSLTSRIKLI